MAKVIDLTDGDGNRDVLTQTEAEGLLGGTLLRDRPLASYLDSQEQPKYLLQNKKSGLRIADDTGEQTLEPDGDFRALALATDLRLLVVVGGDRGDESRSLSLSEIVEADVESGLRSSTLSIETLSGVRWEFPCRGDPEVVATYLEDAAQAWANAGRLLDELEEALDEADERLDDDEYEAAAGLITDAESTMQTATARGQEIGPGAHARISTRASTLRGRLQDVRREIRASAAARAHAQAQDHWQTDEYEAAASAYESAIESYEKALDIDGSTPDDETLRARLRGATGERELLRVGPLVDADAARRQASSLSDSEAAAEQWEQALEGYRELLGLDWGSDRRDFVVNRERIREQTVEIADDAIDDHLDAGIQWLQPGDELAVEGSDYEAEELYKMARHQFEQANRLATEVRPDRVDEIEAAIAAVETRLDGEVPRVAVPADPLTTEFDQQPETGDEKEESEEPAVELSADSGVTDDTEQSGDPDEYEPSDGEFDQLSFPSAADETTHADGHSKPGTAVEGGSNSTATAAERTTAGEEGDASSLLDEIQSRKQGRESTETTPAETVTDDATPSTNPSDAGDATPEQSTDDETTPSEEPRTDGARPVDESTASEPTQQLSERLRGLDPSALTDLVAAVWEAEGWSTRVFDGGADATYDIVATHEGQKRQLFIWTLQRPDGGDVGEALLRRCVTTLENSPSADGGVLVTTGSVTRAAESLAVGFDVEIVDCAALVERVDSADLSTEPAALLRE